MARALTLTRRPQSEATSRLRHNRNTFQFQYRGPRTGLPTPDPEPRKAPLAHRSVVLPQQATLRRSGRLRPASQPRAGRPRALGGGLLRPALPGARRGRDASPRCPASTSTASPTRSGRRAVRSSATWSTSSEVLTMWTAGFPEPRTFCPRVAPAAGASGSTSSTSCTTTRCSATACSTSPRMGLPLVTTIHHPITFDRRIDLAAATTRRKKLTPAPLVRLPADAGQGGAAASARSSPSRSRSRRDIVADFGVDPAGSR